MSDTNAAQEALLNYTQADRDGVMVFASRQAIHEVCNELDRLRAINAALLDGLHDIADGMGETDQCAIGRFAPIVARAAIAAAKGSDQ